MHVSLGWGRAPLSVELPAGAQIVEAPSVTERPWAPLVEAALARPIGSAPWAERAASAASICVLIPDSTRKGVAAPLLAPILAQIPAGVPLTLGVAGGKHPPEPPPAEVQALVEARGGAVWSHDAGSAELVPVGRTAHGTEVCFPRQVVEAALVVTLGEIRPHYFAGYAGGCKGLFPGAAGAAGVWHNHALKAAPGARLGVVEGNPCRADLEAAAALAGPAFIVNVIRGPGGDPVAAVAGDPVAAHRAGVALARPVFEVPAPPPAPIVIVSDGWPVTMNLYQACKLLVPGGLALAEGGALILAAGCEQGLGPVEIINEKIYRLGVIHSLPRDHHVILVSAQPEAKVAQTFARYAPDMATALEMARAITGEAQITVMPRAGDLVPSLVAEGLDGIQAGGAAGGEEAKDHAHRR